jgi:hypothetical protein
MREAVGEASSFAADITAVWNRMIEWCVDS